MLPTRQCQARNLNADASADAAVSFSVVRTLLRLHAASVENEHEAALDTFRNVPLRKHPRSYKLRQNVRPGTLTLPPNLNPLHQIR